jgi:ABC-type antimicrobial peptide transport system permease subunit
VIRTPLDPSSLVPAVREAVREIDPALPLRRVQPLEAFLKESLAPERFRTTLLTIIAILGLALAVLGIYGVTYRGVVDRRREFAVRVALGSERAGVLRMVIVEAVRDVASGVVAGVAGGVLLCGALARLVDHVSPASAETVVASVAVLLVAATAASVIPALRVLRLDPAEALRSE